MARRGRLARAPALAFALLPLVASCELFPDPALEGDLEIVESERPLPELERRIARSDELYDAEPRAVESVEHALELCATSISRKNGFAGLWRAARACYWLAGNHPDDDARIAFGHRGVKYGRAAGERTPRGPAGYYYHALVLGRLSELEGRGLRRVPLMEALGEKVVELDERYAHAGGHRFLGVLYRETMDNPLAAVGDIDDALEHLARACELAPDYGGNQLAYAEALIEDEERDEARESLERVLASSAPAGETRAWNEWRSRARVLLKEITK